VREMLPAWKSRRLRHAAVGRLEAHQPAERRGDAHRAAAVGADADRTQARRHRRGGAAARAARCEHGVPGVARDPEHRTVGEGLEAELREVRLAEDDGAGRLQASDRDVVRLRHQLGEEPRAARRAEAARVERVLERERHTVQRAERLALHHRDLRLARGHARDVGRDHAEGVEARVQRLDAGQQRLGDLDGRELLVTDERGDLERRPPGEILVNQESILRTRRIVSSGA